MEDSPPLAAELEHLNASLNESWANPFVQPPWQVALWAVAYALIVVVAVVGNAVVMWIILAHKRMRTVTNYLLVNLAFAEAAMAALNTVVNFSYAVHNEWYFGPAYCRFHNFFPIAAVFASIYSMTAIALDRSVIMAVGSLLPRDRSVTMAVGSLLPRDRSVAMAVGSLLHRDRDRSVTVATGSLLHRDRSVTTAMGSLLPRDRSVAAAMGSLQHGDRSVTMAVGSLLPRDRSDGRPPRQVVKMMIIVVCTFALCWLPYHVYFTLQYLRPEWYLRRSIQQVYLAVMWLAMSSTMYNPIIYCCLNDRFRVGFKHAFRWCPWVSAGEYEGLELRSARFLHTHSSVSKLSRMDTATVASALGAADEELDEPGRAERLSLDMTSNGSSRSDSKTVSESLSFYSNTPT
ncbi:NK1R protein, partial [Cercotrichas coryphoeus]|nr:NK1R protein [Cercotrichas coryphoeus]